METFLTGGSSGLFCSGVRWEAVGFHVLPFHPSGGPGQRGARPPARGPGTGGVCKKPRYHGRCDKWQRFAKSSEGCGRPPGAADLPGRDPHPSFGDSALQSLIAPAKGIFILFYILCLMSCKAQRYLTRGQLGSGGRVPTRAPGAPGATFALPWRGRATGAGAGEPGSRPGAVRRGGRGGENCSSLWKGTGSVLKGDLNLCTEGSRAFALGFVLAAFTFHFGLTFFSSFLGRSLLPVGRAKP